MRAHNALALLSAGLLALVSLATAPPTGLAAQLLDTTPPARWVPPPDRMGVSLEVLVNGRPLPTVEHRGRVFLPVRLGDEYAVRVSNSGPRRVLAIVSVDGLSVITGAVASVSQPGYVLSAGGSITIKGWRKDLARVAAFRFAERERSYAAQTGRPDNVGVIGLVAIEEAEPRPLPLAGLSHKDAAGPESRAVRPEVGSTGTEYGPDRESPAQWVLFVRGANRRTQTLYYDTAEALRAAGVPVDRSWPNPFPGDPPPHR